MNIVVVGSRTFNDYALMDKILKAVTIPWNLKDVTIYTGDNRGTFVGKVRTAEGADRLAIKWANDNRVGGYKIFHADWDAHGTKAGPYRNTELLDAAGKDARVIVFWNGFSAGTRDTLTKAEARGMKVKIVRFKEPEAEPKGRRKAPTGILKVSKENDGIISEVETEDT